MKRVGYHNLLSEKSVDLLEQNRYVLVTPRKVNKNELKKQIERDFKVKVVKVNSANYLGKLKGVGRSKGKKADFKKIIITLGKNQRIKEFEFEQKSKEKSSPDKVSRGTKDVSKR